MSGTTDTSFANHQGTAIDRQDYAYAVLNDIHGGLGSFVDHENDDDPEIDTKGIDASITTLDDELKFCALKTRSNAKRDLDELDVGLRVAGRSGERSEEWKRFASEDKPVPHILVFMLFDVEQDPERCVEILVVDMGVLKEIYHLGMDATEEHWRIGKVPVQEHSPIDTFGPIDACASNDDGVFMFLDKDDIVDTGAVIAHWQDW